MLVFVIRRLLISIPVLIASTILTFLIVKATGDPLTYLKTRQTTTSPAAKQRFIDQEAHRLWLDRSWPAQYWHWISNVVLHNNWGQQVQGTDNVRTDVFSALSVTARLVAFAIVIALLLAVVTGVVSAVKQYSITDYTTTFAGFLFLSMPVFWFAILLKEYFAIKFNTWTGTQTFYTLSQPTSWLSPGQLLGRVLLPTIVLGLASYAAWSRFTRASMLEVLNSDYIRLARSKGLAPRRVLVRHALRTALIPLTTVTALDTAALLSGAIITETVFQWRGMGYLFLTSLQNRDFNVMLGWLLVTATLVILFNLLADILYGFLDPRIRHA